MNKWLNKNIIALSLVSLFDDFAYELTIAILPAFLISIKSSAATFGLILGISNLFSFLKIISGRLSDKSHARKPFAVFGYTLSSINLCILPFATNWIIVFISWIFAGIGKSIREPSRNALLIESTTPKYYGRVFGFHRAVDSIGAILGPISALFLINYISFNNIFWISFIASAISVLILILFVHQTLRHINISEPLPIAFNIRLLPKKLKLFLLASGIFSLGNFANSLLIFRTIELLINNGLTREIAQSHAIFFYTIYNIVYMICSYPAGHLADKIGTKTILMLGYIFTTIVSIGFMFHINQFVIASLFVLAGIAAAITNSLTKCMTGILTDENIHGIGFGLQTTISGFAFMIANIMVSVLWSQFSPIYGFGYSAIMCLLGTLILTKLVKDLPLFLHQ